MGEARDVILPCLPLLSVTQQCLRHDSGDIGITHVEEGQRTGVCSHYFSRNIGCGTVMKGTEVAILHGQH